VPEIVEADVRQSGSLEKRLERGSGYVVGVQRLSAVGTEDESVILPETSRLETFGVLSRSMGLERLDSLPSELYGASPAVLRRGEYGTALSG
jgi:hypothetical protein